MAMYLSGVLDITLSLLSYVLVVELTYKCSIFVTNEDFIY